MNIMFILRRTLDMGAAVSMLVFLLICWLLLEPRFSRRSALTAVLGFTAVEAVMQLALIFCETPEFAVGLLPVTFYLPAILGIHLLSKRRFVPTALIWLIALLCVRLLAALQKLLIYFTSFLSANSSGMWSMMVTGLYLPLAVLLVLLVSRYLRRPFLAYVEELSDVWPQVLLLPVVLLALYSYYLSSTTELTALCLLFITALTALYVLIRLMISLDAERRALAEHRQMEAMRREYEVLQKKLALGRGYRHDMRHHMAALTALLRQGDYDGAQQYITQWQGQIIQTETETWCRNSAVNAVLSAYLAQAKEAGCHLEVNVKLPEALPFEDVDLCVILANALENAVHACEALPDGHPRRIRLTAALTDNRRLAISVENTCGEDLVFDEDGFPIVPRRPGHGQGLKNIAAAAEKYHGLFQCGCENGYFTLHVVLLNSIPEPRHIRRAGRTAAAIVFLCCLLLNCLPALTEALETIPGLGSLIRVVDLRVWFLNWGSSGLSLAEPVLEGDSEAVTAVETEKEEFIRRMREQFLQYAIQKHQGYTSEDITHELIRDDETLFILRFRAAINAGGSADYSHYVVLDRRTGEVLQLSGLFQPESNYIFPISREIKAQMEEQMKAGEANYFLPGGMWPDEECFSTIEADQNFYINDENQLVIVFDEYEVAPGSMGEPEFVIPAVLLDGLLMEPSILK